MALNLEALSILCEESRKNNRIDPRQFDNYKVKRGLRYPDGTGVYGHYIRRGALYVAFAVYGRPALL